MAGYGRNPWPRRFGGGRREHYAEHIALLDALSKGLDVADDTATYAETYAHAVAISIIWIVNERLANQNIPDRMTDMLAEWEQACRLRSSPEDSVVVHRQLVAAKLRGIAGNKLTDILDTCTKQLGSSFVGLVGIHPTSHVTYWPGVNPGPPGFEWSSNRCILYVKLKKDILSDEDFIRRRAELVTTLDATLPGWMTFRIGIGSSFVVNQGIVGQTYI